MGVGARDVSAKDAPVAECMGRMTYTQLPVEHISQSYSYIIVVCYYCESMLLWYPYNHQVSTCHATARLMGD